jgi:hypothetical protein
MARQPEEEILHPPRVTWSGEGLEDLALERRAQIEAALRGAIARVAVGAPHAGPGGLGLAAPPGSAPAPAPASSAAAGGSLRAIPVTLVSASARSELVAPPGDWSPKLRRLIGWLGFPPDMLAHPLVRDVLAEWNRAGVAEDFNPLLIEARFVRFYEAFCLRMARRMLTRSRLRMGEYMQQLSADRAGWERRLSRLIAWLYPSARRLRDIRLGLVPTFIGPPSGGTILPGEAPTRQRPPAAPGPPSGGTILDDEPLGPAPATAEEVARLDVLINLARELEPLLVVLSIRDGREQRLEDVVVALVDAAPSDVFERVLGGLEALQRETIRAQQELSAKVAVTLAFVREEADLELGTWLSGNRAFSRAVARSGGGIPISATLGVAAFVLMFIFPPGGVALGATVGVTSAASSVSRAIRLSRSSGARIAQSGFRPLVSEEEFGEALTAAILDVIFAIVDVAEVGAAVFKATRSAARQAGRTLGQSLERTVLASWREFDAWPERLLERLRARARAHLPGLGSLPAGEAKRLLDASVRRLQTAMLARYEKRLLEVQQDLERAVAAGLRPDELEPWLRRQLPPPASFLDDLAGEESLLDDVLGPTGRGGGEVPPAPGAAEAVAAFERELGPLASVLTLRRLAWLRQLTGTRYVPLARRLAVILAGAEDAAAALKRLERLLDARRDGLRILEALERSPAPLRVLESLTPELLNVSMVGGFEELFTALLAGAPSRVLRVTSDVNRFGETELLRELAGPGGDTAWERWVRSRQGWSSAPEIAAPPPLPTAPARGAPLPVAAAERARRTRDLLSAAPGGDRLVRDLDAAGREGQEILAALGAVDEPLSAEPLAGISHFLRGGGDPRVLSEILARLSGRTRRMHSGIRALLEQLPKFRPGDLHGLKVALAARRWSVEGVDDILQICDNFSDVNTVFGALADVADRSEGLGRIIGQLANPTEATRQGTLGQLLLGRKLLAEAPSVRIAFEVPIEVEGVLVRRLDIQVLSPITRTLLFEVESKEITRLASITSAEVRRQFAKDVARSAAAARAGEAPLERVKWFVREDALLAEGAARGLTSQGLRDRVRDTFRRAFELGELSGLTAAQRAGALKDFELHFDRIVGFF